MGVGLHFVSLDRWKSPLGCTYVLAWPLEGPVMELKGYPVLA
ncbi:AttH protein [Thermus scotoductus]|nr:AttH protein [Thermus scotoductus]HAR69078.1 AttH protein [Thermus scotoductus]